MNTTNTLENIEAIYQAMKKIKNIDKSQCFNEYFDEVITRRKDLTWQKFFEDQQRAKVEAAKGEAAASTGGISE